MKYKHFGIRKIIAVCFIIYTILLAVGCSSSDKSNPFANNESSDNSSGNNNINLSALGGLIDVLNGIDLYHLHPITTINEVARINNGDAAAVRCNGNYCYTVGWNNTNNSFNIIDMSDPTAPVIKSNYNVGSADGIALNGDYAYIQTDGGSDGIFSNGTVGVMNISDLTNPVSVMQNNAGYSTAETIYYYNGHVYSASYNIIGIYSVTDPANLVHVTNINTSGILYLAFAGNYMYGGDNNYLKIWDISNPSAPVLTGSIYNADLGNFNGIATQGNHVYAGSKTKIIVFDVSDKTNPTYVTTLSLTGTGGIDEMKIHDNYLLVTGDYDFYVVDIADPKAPTEVTSLAISSSGYTFGMDLLNNRYAIVSDDKFFHVIKLW
jgi:hypothetical protein